MGGEKFVRSGLAISTPGSPLRRRGKGHFQGRFGWSSRITPAWAGKRAARGGSSSSSWDHPRMGGEKFVDESHFYKNLGSPPRRRGKAAPVTLWACRWRITPAWAGKRQTAAMPRTMTRDHPRVGGEKPSSQIGQRLFQGSPPRGRGKVGNKKGLHR